MLRNCPIHFYFICTVCYLGLNGLQAGGRGRGRFSIMFYLSKLKCGVLLFTFVFYNKKNVFVIFVTVVCYLCEPESLCIYFV